MGSMSIRFPDEIQTKMAELARDEHISMNAAMLQAAELWIEQRTQEIRTRRLVKRIMAEDAALLDRLADS